LIHQDWEDSKVSKTAYPEMSPPDTVHLAVEENPPLSAEHQELFRSLDKLLTIGSYYTPEHARYQEVARQAHAAIRDNLAGQIALDIECSSEGMWVHDEFIAGDLPETHRVFELINDLNIGLLEISAEATSDDLHEVVTSLKYHRVTYLGPFPTPTWSDRPRVSSWSAISWGSSAAS
jgi:hypothetical protein